MILLDTAGLLRIGIGQFDREHQEIAKAINRLQVEVEDGNHPPVTGPMLEHLARITQAHFVAEETMMKASKYPGTMLHAMKHQRLLEQLTAFRARYSRDTPPMDRHSLNFLRDWVNSHIHGDDMNFGLWLNEHGKR